MSRKHKTKITDTSKPAGLFVGTSGWSYEHWQDIFYPEHLAKKGRFVYFASQFSTVELNATFYRLFPEKTFKKWAAQAPEGFVYAVKLWCWITHRKRLKGVQTDLQTFLARAALLADHLGPILVQLPPNMHRNDDVLKEFLKSLIETQKALKKSFRVTIEFRHRSWFDEDVYRILTRFHVALCLADMPKLEFPRQVTGDFIYVRFHGRSQLYRSLYDKETLIDWSNWLSGWLRKGNDVFVYFNNDFDAHAVRNARQLREMLDKKTRLC